MLAEAHLDVSPWATRAAVLDGGALAEMYLEWALDGLRAGAVVGARLLAHGLAAADGEEALLERARAMPEGASVFAEVVRMAIPEPGRRKPARLRLAEGPARPAPSIAAMLQARGHRLAAGWPEPLEEAWEARWQDAEAGRWPVAGGLLRFQPTAAFLAVDIDGEVEADQAARELARAIRCWDLGGNIVVDFPTRPGRAWRQAAAAAFDAAMAALPYERTAINGYGLLQVVRPRTRPSILERALLMRDEAEAVALLSQVAREPRPGRLSIVARPAVARLLKARPDLIAAAARIAGRPVDVVAEATAGTGHVAAA
ncbi:ribonuclease [Thermaurantiacus sp.]